MSDAPVWFQVLGSLSVTVDGIPARLGGPKQRAVLAVLLAHAGQPISRGALIHEVWGDDAPATAENTVQVYVSQLRRVLGSGTVATSADGYCAPVSVESLDAARFTELVAAGRRALHSGDAEHAARCLRAGLALWQGDAFFGFTAPSVVAETARLTEERLGALELVVEADIKLGRHVDVIPELRSLTAMHPTREAMTAQLMLALYRSGRQAEAIEVYATLRRHLNKQRGIEPGTTLRALHRQILAQDPDLAPHTAEPVRRISTPTTTFVGRDQELRHVARACTAHALVTITGVAGCGKTRLALETARSVEGCYADGSVVVELSRISEPALVPFSIASALGTALSSGADPIDLLALQLDGRQVQLILDTCEHVKTACAETVERLLEACPTVQLLATSRVPLGLPGELVFRLQPLSVPDTEGVSAEHVLEYPAARLLVDRASDVAPDFVVTPDNAQSVAALSRLLEGIPLAIELAAARTRHVDVATLETELQHRILGLEDQRRIGDPKERSLRAALSWSYGLLKPSEQALFDRLSVFSGWFDEDDVVAVCADSAVRESVSTCLRELRDSSLVTGDGPYRMLDSIRAFAAERLAEAGESDRQRRRHLRYFEAFAGQAGAGLMGPAYASWMDRLNRSYPDLRAAAAWALDHGDAESAGRLMAQLHRYILAVGYDDEWTGWLEEALNGSLSTGVRARVLCARAWAALLEGDTNQAEDWFFQARDAAQAATTARALASVGLGSTWFYARADEGAITELSSAIDYARAEDDQHSLVTALNALGCVYATIGEGGAARRYFSESLEAALAIGDPELAVYPRGNLGWQLFTDGHYELARDMVGDALASVEALGNPYLVATGRADLGFIALACGDYGEASELWHSALRAVAKTALADVGARALMGLGCLAAATGDPRAAAKLWGAADAEHRRLSAKPGWVELTIAGSLPKDVRPHRDPHWANEWAQGASLSLGEAIGLVEINRQDTVPPDWLSSRGSGGGRTT